MPARIDPSITRVRMITPRYGSYQESKINAFSGAAGSPVGGGSRRNDGFEDFVNPGAFLRAREDRPARVKADDLLDLPLAPRRAARPGDRSC